MKATSLQAMIRINATRITDIHINVAYFKEQVAYQASLVAEAEANQDIPSFNVHQQSEYFAVEELRHQKKKLVKAVELQREMKAELAWMHRENRIDSMLDKLATVEGVELVAPTNITSYELEALVKAKIKEVFPPKKDTRVMAA